MNSRLTRSGLWATYQIPLERTASIGALYGRNAIPFGAPAACQVVVKCMFSNMLLVSYEYDTHRILAEK